MANENLKIALAQAGLTAEQLATTISVDPKTVQRWVSGRTPYPRHRATIARALNLTEHALWPDDVPPPTANPDRHARDPHSRSEVTGTWAHDTDPGAPDPVTFVTEAGDRIDVLDSYGELLHTPGLTAALMERAAGGCQIRGLMDEPSHHVRALIGHDGIELRVCGGSHPVALVRAGDTMLLKLMLEDEADQPAPLLQLNRHADGGLFDRLLTHLDATWDACAEETLTEPEQLDSYLADSHRDWAHAPDTDEAPPPQTARHKSARRQHEIAQLRHADAAPLAPQPGLITQPPGWPTPWPTVDDGRPKTDTSPASRGTSGRLTAACATPTNDRASMLATTSGARALGLLTTSNSHTR